MVAYEPNPVDGIGVRVSTTHSFINRWRVTFRTPDRMPMNRSQDAVIIEGSSIIMKNNQPPAKMWSAAVFAGIAATIAVATVLSACAGKSSGGGGYNPSPPARGSFTQ